MRSPVKLTRILLSSNNMRFRMREEKRRISNVKYRLLQLSQSLFYRHMTFTSLLLLLLSSLYSFRCVFNFFLHFLDCLPNGVPGDTAKEMELDRTRKKSHLLSHTHCVQRHIMAKNIMANGVENERNVHKQIDEQNKAIYSEGFTLNHTTHTDTHSKGNE